MKKLAFTFFSLFPFFFFIFGCTPANTNIKIAEIGTYPQPLIEPLPLNIGVHYRKEFQEFEITKEPPLYLINDSGEQKTNNSYGPWNIQLGKANIVLFDYILPHVFKKIIPIHHIPEDIAKIENIDAIIEPSIVSYRCEFVMRGLTLECHVQLTYAVTFYTPNSKQIGPWLINGKGFFASFSLTPETYLREATQIAMRDVAAQFISGFCYQTDIKKLFYKQCNQ